jgi:Arc/MetJ family transcription regulator
MATNLDIDQALLEKAVELSGKRSKKDAVTMALEEFVARRNQKGLLELFGKIDWDPDYDYKAERSRK